MIILYFKKALIGILAFCFLSSLSFAQVYSNKPSSTFSFTAGFTSSNLIKDSIRFKSGISFTGGFIYSVALSDKFNIAANVLYTGKAFKNESPIVKYRYYYVDVPLYLQYNLSDNIRLNFGGQYSTFTNSKIIVTDQTNKNGVNVIDYKSIKNTDYGLLAGIEIDLNEDVSLAARYTISTSTFFEKNKINFGVFQLTFGYVAFRTHRQFFHKKESAK